MLSVDAAQREVLERAVPLAPEEVPIVEASGRVLAEDVCAPWSLPPADNAAMDGCAVRHADLVRGGPLRLAGSIAAGAAGRPLAPGEAVKIMTGAPVPPGGDNVVPVETLRFEEDRVVVLETPEPGAHVRPAGEDVTAGERVLRRGAPVRPAEVAMLASLGRTSVRVVRRPRVAVMSTGNEVVEPDAPDAGGRIRDANGYALCALVREAGGVPVRLGIVADERSALASAVGCGLACDVLLTSGGVSAGDYDYLPEVLAAAEVAVRFHKVAIKPGKPVLFGTRGRTLAFGLPGNPVACVVAFEQFVRPALRRLQGWEQGVLPRQLRAVLGDEARPVRHKTGRTEFRRCRVVADGDGLRVVEVMKPGSGLLSTLVRGNGFLVLDESCGGVEPGTEVTVQPYGGEPWPICPAAARGRDEPDG